MAPLVFLLGLSLALGACTSADQQSSDPSTLRQEAQAVFSPAEHQSTENAEDQRAADDEWSIVISAFRGPNKQELAEQALAEIRTKGRLPGAYIDTRGDVLVVAYGRYPSANDPQAQRDLKRIRTMEIGGVQPYRDMALLTPPLNRESGRYPEYELARAAREAGDWALYTLQVGVYSIEVGQASKKDMQEVRTLAEEAAADLRREGEQAFYYHGPNRSMVTIGLWGESDFDPATGQMSPLLEQKKEKFPHNLLNGRAIRETIGGRTRLQPSALVMLPK